jgi:hypothetical protein
VLSDQSDIRIRPDQLAEIMDAAARVGRMCDCMTQPASSARDWSMSDALATLQCDLVRLHESIADAVAAGTASMPEGVDADDYFTPSATARVADAG